MKGLNTAEPLMMHIDINSCFATVAQQVNPFLRGKPLVIASYATERGCVLAASVEAKRYGVKTGMRVYEARLLCRCVIVQTADIEMIFDVHERLRSICADYSPHVTPKSVDEFVVDFAPVAHLMKHSVSDVVSLIKNRVRREIGEWMMCSVGLAPNRFLAKTGASLHKPDGFDIIRSGNLRFIYSQLSLVDLCGINKGYEARLHACGIFTPLEFLDASPDVLEKQVFRSVLGRLWYMRLRGWEVDAVDFDRKSFGQEYALPQSTNDFFTLSQIMMKLCEKMGRRLRKAQKTARGVHLRLVYADNTSWHNGQIFDGELYTTGELYKKICYIFEKQPEKKMVKKIGVSCYGLSSYTNSQQSLFSNDEKGRLLSDAMDAVNDRYGEFVVGSGLLLGMSKVIVDRISFGASRSRNYDVKNTMKEGL